MKTFPSHLRLKWLIPALLVLGISLGSLSIVLSQGTDVEPNNSCAEAADLGEVTLPFTLDGSLDTPPDKPDIDFFKFSGPAGSLIRADMVSPREGYPADPGALGDPLLGLFDSGCNLLAYDDDGGIDLDARLRFAVPEDGIYILAAASYPDYEFIGNGGTSGLYQLQLAVSVPGGSISGRVVDQVSGEPLPGETEPFTTISLYSCSEGACEEFVNFMLPDGEGRFRFETDYLGQTLEARTYQLEVLAAEYFYLLTEPFELGPEEHLDLGDVQLEPYPVRVRLVRACEDLPATGGLCRYSLEATNRQVRPLRGAAWSLVYASETGSLLGYTVFQFEEPREARLLPGESKVFRFGLPVPGTVADGAVICPVFYFSRDHEIPYYDTLAESYPFCVVKGEAGFSLVTGAEARRLALPPGREARPTAGPAELPSKPLPEK
jgi:hypothetical protein